MAQEKALPSRVFLEGIHSVALSQNSGVELPGVEAERGLLGLLRAGERIPSRLFPLQAIPLLGTIFKMTNHLT